VVLLVEDEVGTQDALATLLRLDGWEVVGAYDGEQALAVLAERIPDVIVTDYMMPNLDGLEMIEQIKASTRLASIPIVMMSAIRLSRESRRNVEVFLPKPIDLTELRKVLATLVHRGHGPDADSR
jgi:CheY-like chemotaxis protein